MVPLLSNWGQNHDCYYCPLHQIFSSSLYLLLLTSTCRIKAKDVNLEFKAYGEQKVALYRNVLYKGCQVFDETGLNDPDKVV